MGVGDVIRSWLLAEPRKQRAIIEQRAAGNTLVPWRTDQPQWLPRDPGTYDRDAYRKVALIFRCVQYLANATGSAPLKVYLDRGGVRDEEPDHPLRWLMERPNPGMGEGRFLSMVAMMMAVAGFCVIEKERNRAGEVINLWVLRSDWLRPIPRQQAQPDWEYRVPGYERPFRLSSEDVIAVPYADTPTMDPTGIGPLEAILREVGITSAMTDFLKTFMDRGAMPLYVMVPSDDPRMANQWADQSKIDAFREAFRQRYGGLPDAVDPMPLVGIKDIKPLGLDFNQLAYPDLNKMADARICTGFGIPPILVGAEVGLEQATYSNYGQARTSFYEDTMAYVWARIDDAFTRHLMPEFEVRPGYAIDFDTSDIPALKDDENEAHDRAVAAFQSALVSRHAAQRKAGYEPHGPDVFLVPFNLIEQGNDAGGQRQRATAELVEMPAATCISPNGHKSLPEPAVVEREGRRYVNERAMGEPERRALRTVVTTHRTAILQLANVLEPQVAAYLAEQRERVVEAVTGERSVLFTGFVSQRDLVAAGNPHHYRATRAVEDIDWDAETTALRRILESWVEGVGAAAFAEASGLIGSEIDWSVSNPYLSQLHDVLARRVVGITDTTRSDIERVVTEALTEGTTMPDLAERLTGLYEETYNGRSMAIARTESQVAYNTASGMAYEASGQVSEAQLHDNPAHTTDPGSDGLTCAQRNGLIVHVSQLGRHIAGEHVNGTLAVSPIVRPLGEV